MRHIVVDTTGLLSGGALFRIDGAKLALMRRFPRLKRIWADPTQANWWNGRETYVDGTWNWCGVHPVNIEILPRYCLVSILGN